VQNDAGALRHQCPTNKPEDLTHAIVYPAKTKPREAFRKQSSTCGNADAQGDGDGSSHQNVAAGVAMNRCEETYFCRRAFLRSGSAMLLAPVLGAIRVSGSETNIHRRSQSMPADTKVVKDLMKQNLHGIFSERDAVKRRSLIAKIWDAKGIFIDPEGRYVGHAAINEAAEQLQHRFPGFTFSELADGDANSGVGRLPWGFGPPSEPRKITGVDVLVASDDGRITAVYTFVDAVKG
jgi:hypothetical protein